MGIKPSPPAAATTRAVAARDAPCWRAGAGCAAVACRVAARRAALVSGGQSRAASRAALPSGIAGAAVRRGFHGAWRFGLASSSVTHLQPSGSLPGTAVIWPPGCSASGLPTPVTALARRTST